MKKSVLFLIAIIITVAFSSCMKEDDVMFNTGQSIRADFRIVDNIPFDYPSGCGNVTIWYEVENLSYWNIDYYEVLFTIKYRDTSGVIQYISEIDNGSQVDGRSVHSDNVFVEFNGVFLSSTIENYEIYN